ncbi:hypothetical protein HFN47_22435 [Rhizobium leguminosarum]|nr:hypothetical protein [Rhizobium leguminosarum]MBY5860581.1 hypothetical protein [Rhizobium leguminosarum]
MATAYHMVHYRRVSRIGGERLPKNFEGCCRDVLGSSNAAGITLWNRIQDRIHSTDEGRQQIILNRVADLSSAVFGEMCLVETQGIQPLLQQVPSNVTLSNLTIAEIFSLEERQAPEGSKFVRGMAYWLAIGDHFFFVKTQSMAPRYLRNYFDWLLKGKPEGLPADMEFELQAEFDKTKLSGDIGEIRSLRVKGGSAPQFEVKPVFEDESKEISTTKKIADRFVQFSQAVPVIEALFGKAKAQSLVDSLGPQEYLAVDASVKVRGRRTVESKHKMKELTNELADITDGSVQVEGKGGRISDGDAILRTTMPFLLEQDGASLLNFDNVADQLQLVYSRFVQDGMIEA